MTPAVVDCSVAIGWCFADEASAAGDEMLDHIRDHGAVVPGFWFLEIGNLLVQAEKRNKILAYDVAVRLELISALPIAVDQNMVGLAWTSILDLARTESLSVYNAAYLELAIRRRLPLFTQDKELAAAAQRRHVRLAV